MCSYPFGFSFHSTYGFMNWKGYFVQLFIWTFSFMVPYCAFGMLRVYQPDHNNEKFIYAMWSRWGGFSVYSFINQLFSAFYKWQHIFSVSIHIFNRYLLNTYFVAFALPDTEHFSGDNIVSSPHIQKYGYRGGEVNT